MIESKTFAHLKSRDASPTKTATYPLFWVDPVHISKQGNPGCAENHSNNANTPENIHEEDVDEESTKHVLIVTDFCLFYCKIDFVMLNVRTHSESDNNSS